MVQFIDGKPSRPLRRPNRRHFLRRVSPSNPPKHQNTVILPKVDVAVDVRAINAGRGVRHGNTVSIHGRLYEIKPTGLLYPISGDGFVQLNRGAYKALGYYNECGVTDLAEEKMDQARITPQSRELARHVLEAGDRDE